MKVQLKIFFGDGFSFRSCDAAAVDNKPNGILQFTCPGILSVDDRELSRGKVILLCRGGLKEFVKLGATNDPFYKLCYNTDVAAKNLFVSSGEKSLSFHGLDDEYVELPWFTLKNNYRADLFDFDVMSEKGECVIIAFDLAESVVRAFEEVKNGKNKS